MVLYPNKLPESERVCSGICTITVTKQLPGIHKALTRAVGKFPCINYLFYFYTVFN